MKVLFLNNYPMDEKWRMWKENLTAGHHLWGVTQFEKYGLELRILPHEKYTFLKKISEKLKLLGNLDQQLRILLKQNEFDAIYTGHYYNTFLLAFLRRIGLFKKPIFAAAHQSLPTSPFVRLFFKYVVQGHDKLICLSPRIKQQFQNDFQISQEKLEFIDWGIDLPYCDKLVIDKEKEHQVDDSSFILSAGKTHRDYNTLTQALNDTDYNLRIYCTKDSAPDSSYVSNNIQVTYDEEKIVVLSDEEIYKEHKESYAVAIPLDANNHNSHSMIGITSLLDSMAMGKASIVTRNPQIGIDIEQEGIGIWVDNGDVEGWKNAITYLMENPEEAKAMGQRARHLCEAKYNLKTFSDGVGKIVQQALN